MEKDISKIIVWTNPTAPFQKIYVFKNGNLMEQMGVKFEDAQEIISELCKVHNINQIDFSGTTSYGQKIGDELKKNCATKYGFNTPLEISYI